MPRAISVMRKKCPAWSIADSFFSFQRSGLGSLNFEGGGPVGVAKRRAEVEKAAAAGIHGDGVVRDARMSCTDGRQSIERGFVDAIVLWEAKGRRGRGRVAGLRSFKFAKLDAGDV